MQEGLSDAICCSPCKHVLSNRVHSPSLQKAEMLFEPSVCFKNNLIPVRLI